MTPSQKFSKAFTLLSFEISLEGCFYCTFITNKTISHYRSFPSFTILTNIRDEVKE